MQPITFHVAGPPPAKDGGKSIFSPGHPHYPRVVALRRAVGEAMAGRLPFEGVPIRLEVVHHRARGRADGLNVVNGIADVLQRRAVAKAYGHDVCAFDDDANVREISYREVPAADDAYDVVVSLALVAPDAAPAPS